MVRQARSTIPEATSSMANAAMLITIPKNAGALREETAEGCAIMVIVVIGRTSSGHRRRSESMGSGKDSIQKRKTPWIRLIVNNGSGCSGLTAA
jgi:hypothetical protein